MANIMETVNVNRKFGAFQALYDINVAFPEGGLSILRGRSGSGKTTLLNILGALDYPTSGQVIFEGQDITRLSEKERTKVRRFKTGYVFQTVALVPMMSAVENVDFALRLAGWEADKRMERAMECLRLVGLEKRATHFPQELSGGEQQRVAIARALAKNPKLLLCDEPTGALDYLTGKAILKLLQDSCRRSGTTVIIITHNKALCAMADRVIRVKSGTIVSEELNTNPVPVEEIEW